MNLKRMTPPLSSECESTSTGVTKPGGLLHALPLSLGPSFHPCLRVAKPTASKPASSFPFARPTRSSTPVELGQSEPFAPAPLEPGATSHAPGPPGPRPSLEVLPC
jgi:hypothetical protein